MSDVPSPRTRLSGKKSGRRDDSEEQHESVEPLLSQMAAGGEGSKHHRAENRWSRASLIPPLAKVLANAKALNVTANKAAPLPDGFALDSWCVDAYAVSESLGAGASLLQSVAMAIAKAWGLIGTVVTAEALEKFMAVVDFAYLDNPYHNRTHAADILQSTYALVSHCPSLVAAMSAVEKLGLIVGAACHDVQHPGRSNNYMIAVNDPMAVRYGNRSVLEHHHLAVPFEIMGFFNECDITALLGYDDVLELRAFMANLILSTDMSKHMPELAGFEVRRRKSGAATTKAAFYADKESRHATLALLMHAADISGSTKPLSVAQKWTSGILAEMAAETEEAKAKNLKGVMLMGADIPRGQLFFIDVFVAPLYHVVVEDIIETPMHTIAAKDGASQQQDPWRGMAEVRGHWAIKAGAPVEIPPRKPTPQTAEEKLAALGAN